MAVAHDTADTNRAYSELGQQRLAAMLNISESTVGRATMQLVKADYLSVKRVGLGQPNRLYPVLHRLPQL